MEYLDRHSKILSSAFRVIPWYKITFCMGSPGSKQGKRKHEFHLGIILIIKILKQYLVKKLTINYPSMNFLSITMTVGEIENRIGQQ